MDIGDNMKVTVEDVSLVLLASAMHALANTMDKHAEEDDGVDLSGLLHANYLLACLLDGYVAAQDAAEARHASVKQPRLVGARS